MPYPKKSLFQKKIESVKKRRFFDFDCIPTQYSIHSDCPAQDCKSSLKEAEKVVISDSCGKGIDKRVLVCRYCLSMVFPYIADVNF